MRERWITALAGALVLGVNSSAGGVSAEGAILTDVVEEFSLIFGNGKISCFLGKLGKQEDDVFIRYSVLNAPLECFVYSSDKEGKSPTLQKLKCAVIR